MARRCIDNETVPSPDLASTSHRLFHEKEVASPSKERIEGRGGESRASWDKQLYRKQPYPDNYVDQSFRAVLRKASTSPPAPELLPLITSALVISVPLSSTFLFIGVFIELLNDRLPPEGLIWATLLAGLFGYGIFIWFDDFGRDIERKGMSASRNPLRPSIITLLLLHSLSPILRTLTEATTSDSVWPLAGSLLVLGIVLGDYGSKPNQTRGLASSLSLTSTLSASVVLASRLATNTHVFALVLFSVVLFALAPSLWKRLRAYNTAVSFLFVLLTCILLARSSFVALRIYAFLLLAIVVGAPVCMIRSWHQKSVIKGNWDVANPIVRRAQKGDG